MKADSGLAVIASAIAKHIISLKRLVVERAQHLQKIKARTEVI